MIIIYITWTFCVKWKSCTIQNGGSDLHLFLSYIRADGLHMKRYGHATIGWICSKIVYKRCARSFDVRYELGSVKVQISDGERALMTNVKSSCEGSGRLRTRTRVCFAISDIRPAGRRLDRQDINIMLYTLAARATRVCSRTLLCKTLSRISTQLWSLSLSSILQNKESPFNGIHNNCPTLKEGVAWPGTLEAGRITVWGDIKVSNFDKVPFLDVRNIKNS